MTPRFLSIAKAAQLMGYSTRYLKKIVYDGAATSPSLPPHIHARFPRARRFPTGRWVFVESEVLAWKARGPRKGTR